MSGPQRVVLLLGAGSCVPWVLEVADRERLEIVLGLSHKSKAPGLKLLRQFGAHVLQLPRKRFTNQGFGGDVEYMRLVKQIVCMYRPHLVLCLGWDLVLPVSVVNFWHGLRVPTVNLHPALVSIAGRAVQTSFGLIPVIKGEVTHVIAEVLARKLPATGCSLHIIRPTAEVDEGEVVASRVVPVLQGDTAESLRERERAAEKDMVQEFIRSYQERGTL